MEISINEAFQLASDFVKYTHTSLFLTGKAGTGKTTFLKYCRENVIKNIVVVAPTGVAAINAGGTTIHSFFQLPFAPYSPLQRNPGHSDAINDKNSLLGRIKLNNERRDIIKKLELLIIDEISMVRCDVLDAIDTILRHVRNQYSKPFGGLQVLLIGDLHQLPPVVKEDEWQLLSAWYKSPYFFNSHVLENHPPVYVELDKIYRQSDASFVNVLNQVRNNKMDKAGYDFLHSRYLPSFHPSKEENYITLTTHNTKADAINFSALNELKTLEKNFKALIEGEFYERSFPAEEQLKLKMGAQVMFIKNDTEKPRRYYNGKIGIVEKIDTDKVLVLCKGDKVSIEVKKETWRNIRYALDKTTNQVEEQEIGSFTQFPLRLAWAITIHKSQGLTFEKAVIDAGDAFAAGQVYVALSRCTSLEGIILHSQINTQSLYIDGRITAFANTQSTSKTQLEILLSAKRRFQIDEVLNLFDFTQHCTDAKDIHSFVLAQSNAFDKEAMIHQDMFYQRMVAVDNTARKFLPQLNNILEQGGLPEKNKNLQERIHAAVHYFLPALEQVRQAVINSPVVTDNKAIATDLNKLLQRFFDALCWKIYLMEGCKDGFSVEAMLLYKRSYKKPTLIPNAYSGKSVYVKTDGANPALYNLLRNKRDEICEEKKLPVYRVATGNTLDEMTLYLPQTIEQLNLVNGFGPVRSRSFGMHFITIIKAYCEEHDLHSTLPKEIKRTKKTNSKKTDSKFASLILFKAGKTPQEIAEERMVTRGTIDGHLLYYVGTGEVDINRLVPEGNQDLIKKELERGDQKTLKELKDALPPDISYSDIRMVTAALKTQA